MNERYQFRGKRIDNGEWIIGQLVQDFVSGDWYINYRDKCCARIDVESVGQCTGRNAYKGEERTLIFEGDIVRYTLFNYYGGDSQYIGTVEWSDGSFVIGNDDDAIFLHGFQDTESDIEIIGNIHDEQEVTT